MKRSALTALMSIRDREYQEAMRVLANSVDTLDQASQAVRNAEERLLHEREIALATSSGDVSVENYARWLPVGQAAIDAARRDELQARTCLTIARAALITARTARESVRTAMSRQAEKDRVKALKAEQALLDEIRPRRVE
ncbi:hypothetical protein AA103196_0014 [Ameyamaea chiangmaiensis NBRC 103196]|uniref:Flagellar FliJ protein n=1 Tax=Ameyamaea chiangmaiensis TaxID=442969 RepID=A0A850PCU1_9PROT|nr:flagellar export protein FliJ [Ameyamaea chiangmaiensis]MBS4076026.1 flagellar FliJ family protein [Ameyamaea chiangmaiensis]NVN40106.1 flagellar FliJ family protein [Ameyamaea chiangmaiensis]GBQ61415.1 hypothetical protein AA103196_0014 [Ameyamaea chiangmaiensis NBRC 103196]